MTLPFSYSLRNLLARPVRNAMSAGVIALVVVACSLFLGLISSLRHTLVSSADPLNLVVLRKGSGNDGSSQLSLAAYHSFRYFDDIARSPSGRPLVSPELIVQPFVRTAQGGRDNVLVRGVEAVALEVHSGVRIAQGRMFIPSHGEAVVGRKLLGRYRGARLGNEVEFGRRRWRVVGILEAGDSSFESEIWVDARELADDAKRIFPYSGARIRAAGAAAMQRLRKHIDEDPFYALEALPETEYYAKQAESAGSLYVLVACVALLAGTGASFGAANTMYASVQARVAEIGTLRALGFSRRSILLAFQLEAALLALGGFLLGTVLALVSQQIIAAVLGRIAFSAATFSTNMVALRVGPLELAASLLLTVVIGVIGGFGPAWRAARLRPIEALRKA